MLQSKAKCYYACLFDALE